MMTRQRGGHDDGSALGRDDVHKMRTERTERTERLPKLAHGTDLGTDSVARTLDEGAMIARVVQDSIALAITELRALAERTDASGTFITNRMERSLVSLRCGQRLVGELIDLAGLEAGQLTLRREPTDLSELVRETVGHCVLPVQRKGVQIDTRHTTRCRLDRDRIGRVIGSFLQAVVTYGHPSSPIMLRVEELDHRACVSMTDTGPGLTTTQARTIFGKRQSLPGRVNGVGLHVSKKVVEAHGGSVGIDTIPAVGTTFWFKLPVMA